MELPQSSVGCCVKRDAGKVSRVHRCCLGRLDRICIFCRAARPSTTPPVLSGVEVRACPSPKRHALLTADMGPSAPVLVMHAPFSASGRTCALGDPRPPPLEKLILRVHLRGARLLLTVRTRVPFRGQKRKFSTYRWVWVAFELRGNDTEAAVSSSYSRPIVGCG